MNAHGIRIAHFKRSTALAFVLSSFASSNAGAAFAAVDRESVGAGELLRCTEGGFVPLPVLRVNVDLEVTGILLRGTVTEEFANPTEEAIEARYVFPLPDRAAVDFMEMRIGDRKISSVIQEKEEAKATYEKAKSEGKKASLLDERRPNLFEVSIAGIGPGEKVVVELQYLEELPYRDGGIRIAFPLTFTPRYSPRSAMNSPVVATAVAAPPDATIRVRIDAGLPIDTVRSSSHPIRAEREGRFTVVRPQQNPVAADRDFLLEYGPLHDENPTAAIVAEDRDDGRYALLMILPPSGEAAADTGLPTDTLFVVDVSGSMEGSSIGEAREALLAALDRLRPGDGFNLLKFSDESEPFRARSQPAEEDTVEAARAWVRSLEASGGTEILGALVRGTKMMEEDDRNRTQRIILITDGAVDNEEEAFKEVSARIGEVRLHVLGIGGAPNRYLLKKLARFGRGSSEFIAGADEVKDRVDRFLERIDRPALTNVRLDWEGAPPMEAFPLRVPDLYPGDPLLVSMKLGIAHPGTRAVLSGDGPQGHFVSEFEVREGAPAGSGIATRWARAKVDALLDSLHEGADEAEVRRQVIDVAKEFHLVTKYTSLVAVEEVIIAAGPVTSVRVPNRLPCSSAETGELPQGGTDGPLLLRVGLALTLLGAILWSIAGRSRV